jgi:diphthamide synthase subunit DPH2
MKKTIVICGSMSFLEKLNEVRDTLKEKGYNVISPTLSKEESEYGAVTFTEMLEERGGIEGVEVKDVLWNIKTKAIKNYLKYIEKADAVLICNFTKGKEVDRIGDNAFLEMTVAFYLKKKVFVLNGPPYKSSKCEEVIAMKSVFLYGNIDAIKV